MHDVAKHEEVEKLSAADRAVAEPQVAEEDVPLPTTLRFVLVMGTAFLIGWFALFALLKERW